MGSVYGNLFRVSTFGESHGGGVGVVLEDEDVRGLRAADEVGVTLVVRVAAVAGSDEQILCPVAVDVPRAVHEVPRPSSLAGATGAGEEDMSASPMSPSETAESHT